MFKTFKITKQRRAMDNLEHGKGVVVSWDAEGGFGHLQIDDGPAVWGFYSDIEMDGYRTLEAGQRVEASYEAVEDQDGFKWRTVHIKPVSS